MYILDEAKLGLFSDMVSRTTHKPGRRCPPIIPAQCQNVVQFSINSAILTAKPGISQMAFNL